MEPARWPRPVLLVTPRVRKQDGPSLHRSANPSESRDGIPEAEVPRRDSQDGIPETGNKGKQHHTLKICFVFQAKELTVAMLAPGTTRANAI